jgi:branched-subunit amino acid transport protein AzlD
MQFPNETTTPDSSHLPESVFGLIIIYTLANNLEYKRNNGTNHLSFVITKVPAPTPH